MKKSEPEVKNFWNGFLAGGVVAGVVLYAFGTKNGRNGLKLLLSFSEDLDTNIHKVLVHSVPQTAKKSIKSKSSLLETVTAVLDKIQYAAKSS